MDNKYCFIIEKGLNTSYISSLLVAMFLSPSKISDMLKSDLDNVTVYYLQEVIRSKFVEQVRNNRSLELSIVNEIRNICLFMNWKHNENPLSLFNVNDFYTFLLNNIGNVKCNYILNPENVSIEVSTTDLTKDIVPLDKNVDFVSFYVNRKNNRPIDIMKGFKFNGDKVIKHIHSIVCFSERYYAIVKVNDVWYLFDEMALPSICSLDIKLVKERIERDCVLIFYC
jgi:hypothetical protein